MNSNVGMWMVAQILAPRHKLAIEFTSVEYASHIGKSETWANKQIKKMLEKGEIEKTRIRKQHGAARPYYRMVDS